MTGDERGLRRKLCQGADGVRGVALAARFKVFAQHDECNNDRRALKEQVFGIARIAEGYLDHGVQAVGQRGKRADRNERVHIRVTLYETAEAVNVEIAPAYDDGQREYKLHERKGQRRMVRHHEHRKRKSDHVPH